MSTQEQRLAQNQVIFRQANENLERAAAGALLETMTFLCECAAVDCEDTIELTLAEYEAVRADPAHFALSLGHESDINERIHQTFGRYEIVEKTGDSRAVAEAGDPRRQADDG